MTRKESLERWRRLVGEQAASGLSGAAFCREKKLCRKSFYRWRQKFEAEGEIPAAEEPGFAEVVRRVADGAWSGVSILPGPPRTIKVEQGFDAATLAAVLSVVEAAAGA